MASMKKVPASKIKGTSSALPAKKSTDVKTKTVRTGVTKPVSGSALSQRTTRPSARSF